MCPCRDLPMPPSSCSCIGPCRSPWQPTASPKPPPSPHTASDSSPSCKSFPLLISKPRASFVRRFSTQIWDRGAPDVGRVGTAYLLLLQDKGETRIIKVWVSPLIGRGGKQGWEKWLYKAFKLPTHGMYSACVFGSAYYFLWVTFSCALAAYFSQSDLSWSLCCEEAGGVQICSSILEFAPLSVVTQCNPTELNCFCVPFLLS